MSLRRVRAASSIMLLVLASLTWVRCAFGIPSEQLQGHAAPLPRVSAPPAKEGIITGLNPNILIGTLAKEHGFSVKRDKTGWGQAEPVREGELPGESLSLVKAPNLERWGPKFMLRKEDDLIGGLQIGVFADPNTAALMFVDQIHHTSVGPNWRFGSELGDEAVGWWNGNRLGLGRILLRRSNVVASINVLAPGAGKMMVPMDTALALALRLDLALKSGSDGVHRGTNIAIPRILAVKTPKAPIPHRVQHAQVRIALPTSAPAERPEEREVVHDVPFHPPLAVDDRVLPESALRWELVHITADCVVSSQLVQVDPARTPPAQ